MAAKLAALVVAVAALDFFLVSPRPEIAQAYCASNIDLGALEQHYGSAGAVPSHLRAVAVRFNQARQITAGGFSTTVRRERARADCQSNYIPLSQTKSLRSARKRRLFEHLQIGSMGVLPADLYNSVLTTPDFSSEELGRLLPALTEATLTRAYIQVVNRGRGYASNVVVEATPEFKLATGSEQPFRLRPNEGHVVELRTAPGRLGVNPATFFLHWDTERHVNDRLVWIAVIVAAVILAFAVTRDILWPDPNR